MASSILGMDAQSDERLGRRRSEESRRAQKKLRKSQFTRRFPGPADPGSQMGSLSDILK
jgi:hypothetical protein